MATMPFSPCAPNGPCSDKTVQILQEIFGDIIKALTTGTDPNQVSAGANVLATMFSVYNSGVLILASILVSYIAVMGITNTANDGEAMGKNWSSVWTPLRIVFGGTVLLPTASGYSFIQLVVLMCALWGVGFGNMLYKAGVGMGVLSPNGLVQGVNAPGNYYGLREFAKQYVAVSFCAKATNVIFKTADPVTSPSMGINRENGAVPDRTIVSNGRTETTYYVRDRNNKSQIAGGLPFCGTVNLSSYAAQPKADPTDLALEQIHAAVQTQKIATVVEMMAAIDDWVMEWPSDINQPGWDQVNSDDFNAIVKKYEDQIPVQLMAAANSKQSNVNNGMDTAFRALSDDGWASAGGWFQRVGMVRGQISSVLAASVGTVTPPSLSSLPVDLRSILLTNSVSTVIDTVVRKSEESDSYTKSTTPRPEDLASLIPKDPSSDINPAAIRANMDAKMSSFVNRIMLDVVEMATGKAAIPDINVPVVGSVPLCGSAGMGGSINRMKCIGDYLTVARLGVATAEVGIKTVTTALRVLAGTVGSVQILGSGVSVDKVILPLWDWVLEVPIKQLLILAGYIEPLAFYFGVVLPSLPYAIFMIVVVGWVLAVLQSVIASTLWAMMHMTPDRTFIGSQSQGYLLLLSLLMRPPLAILGLFAAILVSDPIINYIAQGFFSMRSAVVSSTGGVGAIAEFLTFAWWMIAFGATLLPVLYMTYGLPQILPDHVLKWIGAGLGDLGETNAASAMRGGFTGALGSGRSTKPSNLRLKGSGGGDGDSPNAPGNSPGSSSPGGAQPLSIGTQGIVSNPTAGQGQDQAMKSSAGGGGASPKDTRRLRDKLGEGVGVALGHALTSGAAALMDRQGQSSLSGTLRDALNEGKLAFKEGADSRLATYKSQREASGSTGGAILDSDAIAPPSDSIDSELGSIAESNDQSSTTGSSDAGLGTINEADNDSNWGNLMSENGGGNSGNNDALPQEDMNNWTLIENSDNNAPANTGE